MPVAAAPTVRAARSRKRKGRRRIVSETVSRGREAGQQAEAQAAAQARGSRGHGRWVALGVVVVVAAGAVAVWRAGVFSPAASSGTGQGAPPPATQPVVRQDLSATMPVAATLGYAGSWTVTGQGGGTLTWLPPAGQVIGQGQALYRVDNGSPVVLLYGSAPDTCTSPELSSKIPGVTGTYRRVLPGPATSTTYPPGDRSSSAVTGTASTSWAVAVVMCTVTGA